MRSRQAIRPVDGNDRARPGVTRPAGGAAWPFRALPVEGIALVGCAAVTVTVLASAGAARAIGGRSAARWCAVIAATLLVAPQLGAREVNGELLAAPFVALGIWALVGVVGARHTTAAARRAVAAGMAATGALLVRQNIVDVFVFAAVMAILWVMAWRPDGHRVSRPTPTCRTATGASTSARWPPAPHSQVAGSVRPDGWGGR